MTIELRPMSEAPKTGPVVEIAVAYLDRYGNKRWAVVHWAMGGGDDQPRFGPAWFMWNGWSNSEIDLSKSLGWIPLPDLR